MNKLDLDYQNLLKDILETGTKKETRNGGTISVFGRQIRHNMEDGFPLLTTKKMSWKSIVTELLWFLKGDTNIKFLVDNGCHIWDGDAYKNYCNQIPEYSKQFTMSKEEYINKIKTDDEFAKKWGELGPIYGAQWRDWHAKTFIKTTIKDPLSGNDTYMEGDKYIDQIQNLINDLKTNPDSRRLMVSAWNVGELDQMVLPPCHYSFQVYTRELSGVERYTIARQYGLCPKYSNIGLENCTEEEHYDKYNVPKRAISLMWNQRSVDTLLGLPFNIASYGLLLEIIAKAVNMVPDQLIGNLGDVHLYSNHIEQAKEQIGRELTLGERRKMVTQEMFNQIYNGGGSESLSHSEIDQWDVPKRTREPFPLPTLNINSGNENWHLLDIDDIVNSLDNDITFKLENYQSHPTIKAPLSN